MSYNQRDNQAYGVCYQHGCGQKLELDTYSDCEKIQELYQNDKLHIPKECLVAGLTALNEKHSIQPLLMWPSCSKDDDVGTIQIINEVNQKMKKDKGYPLINVCTDGDGTRRKVMEKLMVYKAEEFSWFRHINNLPLVDNLVGPDGITANFDRDVSAHQQGGKVRILGQQNV